MYLDYYNIQNIAIVCNIVNHKHLPILTKVKIDKNCCHLVLNPTYFSTLALTINQSFLSKLLEKKSNSVGDLQMNYVLLALPRAVCGRALTWRGRSGPLLWALGLSCLPGEVRHCAGVSYCRITLQELIPEDTMAIVPDSIS